MPSYCLQCRSEIDPDAGICARCGSATFTAAIPDAVPEPAPELLVPAEPPSGPMFTYVENLSGIGGWLILIALSLIVSPFVLLAGVLREGSLLTNPRLTGYLQAHTGLHLIVLFEIATNIIFLFLLLALNFLFFTKKRAFPTYMMLYLGLHFVVVLADIGLAHIVMPAAHLSAQAYRSILGSMAGVAVWIPYFLVSQRVKQTFVR